MCVLLVQRCGLLQHGKCDTWKLEYADDCTGFVILGEGCLYALNDTDNPSHRCSQCYNTMYIPEV